MRDQWVKIALPGTTLSRLSDVLIAAAATQGTSPRAALKDFVIRVSQTSTDDSAFSTVLTGTAQQKDILQRFPLPSGTLARWVELVARTNYGSPERLTVAELEVIGQPAPELATTTVTVDSQANIFGAGHTS